MQQAQDFLDEVDNLAALIADRPEATYDLTTQFKDWTINDVIGHLHMFDVAVAERNAELRPLSVHPMRREELIGARLYTGPMFQKCVPRFYG